MQPHLRTHIDNSHCFSYSPPRRSLTYSLWQCCQSYNQSFWNYTLSLQHDIETFNDLVVPEFTISLLSQLLNKFTQFFNPANLIFYGILFLIAVILLIVFRRVFTSLTALKQNQRVLAISTLALKENKGGIEGKHAKVWLSELAASEV